MKIIIAPDSFKESLSASQAAQVIAAGVLSIVPDGELILLPIADGGEGTVEVLVSAMKGQYVTTWVEDPTGNPVLARWGILPGKIGVIEMAAASGLPLLPKEARDPLHASSYGTGQLLLAALDNHCTRIILGLGGSATNDGGAGALVALGAVLLDDKGQKVTPNPQGLLSLATIDCRGVDPRLAQVKIDVASDVDNPLLGPLGASAVYGPQKGASPRLIPLLEQALARLAAVARHSTAKDIGGFPGSGAAGGLAAGLSIVAKVNMQPGIELILDTLCFRQHLEGTDLVLTGEGKIDDQSAMGKALTGIARMVKEKNIPLIAFCGTLGQGYKQLYSMGVTSIQPIVPGPIGQDLALAQAACFLEDATSRAMRIFVAGRR